VTVRFVVVSIAWRSQWSHDLLGVHKLTVASLLTTESVRRARVAAGVLQWSHDLLRVRSFAGSCFSINDGERDVQLYC